MITLFTHCRISVNTNKQTINIANISVDTSIKKNLNKSEYSLVSHCGDSVFLRKTQNFNMPVTLLSSFGKKTVLTHTTTNIKSRDLGLCLLGVYDWPDSVNYLGNFNKRRIYFDLALLSNKAVKFIKTKSENNPRLIYRLDSLINKKKGLSEKIIKDTFCIKINQKQLESFEFNNNKYYIFSYQSKHEDVSIIRQFIIINNEIKPLTNSCSYYPFIYTLNDSQLFLGIWGGACCTDESELNLFEIKDNTIHLKYIGNYWDDVKIDTSMPGINLPMGN
jgi:hypothetical protein